VVRCAAVAIVHGEGGMERTRWELLGIRSLAATDESAEEFVGTLLIHRVGSPEPVEAVEVRVKRSILADLGITLGRLLQRSTRFTPPPR
jgi:hypothetical protein